MLFIFETQSFIGLRLVSAWSWLAMEPQESPHFFHSSAGIASSRHHACLHPQFCFTATKLVNVPLKLGVLFYQIVDSPKCYSFLNTHTPHTRGGSISVSTWNYFIWKVDKKDLLLPQNLYSYYFNFRETDSKFYLKT